jgi:hypothetical protein
MVAAVIDSPALYA